MVVKHVNKLTKEQICSAETALFNIISLIPKAKREHIKDDVAKLQALLGSTKDMFVDRRKLTWSADGKARKTLEVRAQSLKIHVFWRGGDSIYVTLEEAAKIANRKVSSLSNLLTKHGAWSYVDSNEDIVTMTKLRESLPPGSDSNITEGNKTETKPRGKY